MLESLFNKVAGLFIKKETLTQVFFTEHLRMTACGICMMVQILRLKLLFFVVMKHSRTRVQSFNEEVYLVPCQISMKEFFQTSACLKVVNSCPIKAWLIDIWPSSNYASAMTFSR